MHAITKALRDVRDGVRRLGLRETIRRLGVMLEVVAEGSPTFVTIRGATSGKVATVEVWLGVPGLGKLLQQSILPRGGELTMEPWQYGGARFGNGFCLDVVRGSFSE
jgi:hypothetical protein